jgi:hypothetical protein
MIENHIVADSINGFDRCIVLLRSKNGFDDLLDYGVVDLLKQLEKEGWDNITADMDGKRFILNLKRKEGV